MVKTRKLYRKDFLIGVRLEPQTYQFFSDYSLKCGRKISEIVRVILRKFASFAKDKDMNIELMCNDFLKDLFESTFNKFVNIYEPGSPIKIDACIKNVNEEIVNNSNNVNKINTWIRDIISDLSVNKFNKKRVSLYLKEDYFEVIRRISEAYGLSVSEFFDNLMYIFVHTLENFVKNVNKNSEAGENLFIANLMDFIKSVNILEHEKEMSLDSPEKCGICMSGESPAVALIMSLDGKYIYAVCERHRKNALETGKWTDKLGSLKCYFCEQPSKAFIIRKDGDDKNVRPVCEQHFEHYIKNGLWRQLRRLERDT